MKNNSLIFKNSDGKYIAVVCTDIDTNPHFEKIILDDACAGEYGDLQPNQFINALSLSTDIDDEMAMLDITIDGTHTIKHDTLETCIEKLVDACDLVLLQFLNA